MLLKLYILSFICVLSIAGSAASMHAFQLLWLKTISLMEFDWDSNYSSIQRPCSLCMCMYVCMFVYIVCANVITCTSDVARLDAAGHFDKCFAMWFWDVKRGSRGHKTPNTKHTRARERLVIGIFELCLVQRLIRSRSLSQLPTHCLAQDMGY